MRRVKSGSLLDYSFCRQTVTLYHPTFAPEFKCRRTVFKGAYLDLREMGDTASLGESRERRCFLLLPSGGTRPVWSMQPQEQNSFFIEPGDRVMVGEGPEITSREEWSHFVPIRVPGLCVVKEVAVKRWKDTVQHVEAQTKWYKYW